MRCCSAKIPQLFALVASLAACKARPLPGLATALLQGGIAPREVTSIADIRGYRLYKRGRFQQARIWFELGVRIDPSFEPCAYNAARVAALLKDLPAARNHLGQLRRRGTPLGAKYLRDAAADPDFAALQRAPAQGR